MAWAFAVDIAIVRLVLSRFIKGNARPIGQRQGFWSKTRRSRHESVFHTSVIPALVSLSLTIKPLLEMHIEALSISSLMSLMS